jgi:predicted metal-binding membrane protein
MIAPAPDRVSGAGLGPAFAAARARLGLVALLFVIAGAGWWWTADQMRGMDNGPWTGLGTVGWFLAVWVVMMAAMMFPSVAPTVALYSRMTGRRSLVSPFAFASGYLITWAAAGALAFAFAAAGGAVAGDVLSWDGAGRWVAGATLIVAAVYELTPLKDVCLGRCRSPLGFLLGSWRAGPLGALFALGVMSIVWRAFVAGLIAIEKTVPWRRAAVYGTAAILLGLGVLVLVAPDAIPALTTPGTNPMPEMGMGS